MNCPMCRARLNIRIDAFTCIEAVGGAYLKGRVTASCSNQRPEKKCPYTHSTNFKTESLKVIDRLEKIVGDVMRQLPDLGPWQVFHTRERERRKPLPGRRGR